MICSSAHGLTLAQIDQNLTNSISDTFSNVKESGFLLIADMENSTGSKFMLGEERAYGALVEHNRIVIDACVRNGNAAGIVLNSLGDAVVIKFPIENDDKAGALRRCLSAASSTIVEFERTQPTESGVEFHFPIRTKILLQYYEALRYERPVLESQQSHELVGADIDLAFRLAPVSWRLQILLTESFVKTMGEYCELPEPAALLQKAHAARHDGASRDQPLRGICEQFDFQGKDLWITDAREVPRLKGVGKTCNVFAVTATEPTALAERGCGERLTIKLRQDHNAVILARISSDNSDNDNFIAHVVDRLRDASDGNRLDSEITLFLAAKIFGEFDFFFRVSCIDDESLRRFLATIKHEEIGVEHLEVRSMVTNRFLATRHHARIYDRFRGKHYHIVMAWFDHHPQRDLFEYFRTLIGQESVSEQAVEILEIGEVIHHTPVYAVLACEEISDYVDFFSIHGLRQTACHSYIGHVRSDADAQMRYSLLSGIFNPTGKE